MGSFLGSISVWILVLFAIHVTFLLPSAFSSSSLSYLSLSFFFSFISPSLIFSSVFKYSPFLFFPLHYISISLFLFLSPIYLSLSISPSHPPLFLTFPHIITFSPPHPPPLPPSLNVLRSLPCIMQKSFRKVSDSLKLLW